jgi:hypothetical protein
METGLLRREDATHEVVILVYFKGHNWTESG